MISPVLDVTLRPMRAYARHATGPEPSLAAALRGPALLALMLGSALSLSTTGRLTLRLVVSTSLLWSFVPVLQAATLLVLLRVFAVGTGFARALELYFLGLGPWSLWLLLTSALYAFVPVETVATWSADTGFGVLSLAPLPLAWSSVITYGFLRGALALAPRRALAAWVLHYLLVFGAVAAYFLLSGHLLPRLLSLLPR